MTEFCLANNLISHRQFGFLKGRSAVDNLLLTYDEITRRIDAKTPCAIILFDFAKAFDTVSHEILLKKLRLLGFTGNLLRWIQNFLAGRSMTVSINGTASKTLPVLSGVAQGSVIGPLLFLLFINSITTSCQTDFTLYADDLKIFAISSTPMECSQIQANIDAVYRTATSWNLSFNISKIFSMHFPSSLQCPCQFTINGHAIPNAAKVKDLGVLVDRDFRFHDHVHSNYSKAAGISSNYIATTSNRSPEFMVELYTTHIRPLLLYASQVWNMGYVGDIHKLESVQRRWTKEVANLADLDYASRLRQLDLFSIKGRLLRDDLVLCWQILHEKCFIKPYEIFQFSTASTRGHHLKIFKPQIRTDLRKRFFSFRVITEWNSLPASVMESATLTEFMSRLHRTLGPHLFEFFD